MMSVNPPAATLTTGALEAIASSTTKPRVSDSEGMTKTSALAYACESASPRIIPMNLVLVPWKNSSSSARWGPSPTMARHEPGMASNISLMALMFFSAPRRPTCTSSGPSLPPVMVFFMSSERKEGLKVLVSTPRCQRSSCLHPLSASSFCITLEVTRQRLHQREHILIRAHMGATRPVHRLYRGMYSGMWVWYDTTRGMRRSLAQTITVNTIIPGLEVWMRSGRVLGLSSSHITRKLSAVPRRSVLEA
mmetsp:Transcript_49866/g.95298  ORF Transcript_49866/g.95298 Transcript_49866/m.95298 type:complete len:249 (-) Transcript_49866:671-1417(-)